MAFRYVNDIVCLILLDQYLETKMYSKLFYDVFLLNSQIKGENRKMLVNIQNKY